MSQPASRDQRWPRGPLQIVLGALAVLLHLAGLWLVLVSGLVAPLWAIVVLGIVWLGACVPLVLGLRDGRRWVPLVPLGFAFLWFAAVNLGEIVLGWTP